MGESGSGECDKELSRHAASERHTHLKCFHSFTDLTHHTITSWCTFPFIAWLARQYIQDGSEMREPETSRSTCFFGSPDAFMSNGSDTQASSNFFCLHKDRGKGSCSRMHFLLQRAEDPDATSLAKPASPGNYQTSGSKSIPSFPR